MAADSSASIQASTSTKKTQEPVRKRENSQRRLFREGSIAALPADTNRNTAARDKRRKGGAAVDQANLEFNNGVSLWRRLLEIRCSVSATHAPCVDGISPERALSY
jgi:hypothetical protein